MKILYTLITLFSMSVLLMGCLNGSKPSGTASKNATGTESKTPKLSEEKPVTILLAAAASLEKVYVKELIPKFKKKYPWITVEGTYDSSGKLQTQIEEGLGASVFMSASPNQMTALKKSGLIEENSIVNLLENKIVLISSKNSNSGAISFKDIGKANIIALGDPVSVPAGQYAKEILTNLREWDSIQSKLSLGTNVTEVLNAVAEGSADVGIVYATDAAQMPDRVKILEYAPENTLSSKVIYPVGILTSSTHKNEAKLFIDFLKSKEAQDIFIANGFKSNL